MEKRSEGGMREARTYTKDGGGGLDGTADDEPLCPHVDSVRGRRGVWMKATDYPTSISGCFQFHGNTIWQVSMGFRRIDGGLGCSQDPISTAPQTRLYCLLQLVQEPSGALWQQDGSLLNRVVLGPTILISIRDLASPRYLWLLRRGAAPAS